MIAGLTGFFAVLRGQSFAAHAIPNGAFAGAAGAGLLGLNVIWGLAVFSLAGALGIGALGRSAWQDVVTALVLLLMLGIGALFLSLSTQYAQVTYSLLFGEVFGVSSNVLLPIAALGAVSVAAVAVLYRPLLLASALAEVADARGVSTRRMELCFLVVMEVGDCAYGDVNAVCSCVSFLPRLCDESHPVRVNFRTRAGQPAWRPAAPAQAGRGSGCRGHPPAARPSAWCRRSG